MKYLNIHSLDSMMRCVINDIILYHINYYFNSCFTLSSKKQNTYQGIVITDGLDSYAVYIYKCGEMEWGDDATIGFNAAGDYYENHILSVTSQASDIACVNSAFSEWSNVVYRLSVDFPENVTGPPTVEPRKLERLPTFAYCTHSCFHLFL